MKVRKTAYLNEEDWERFKEKYPNSISARLRFLIKLDLEGKLTSPKGENDSETDWGFGQFPQNEVLEVIICLRFLWKDSKILWFSVLIARDIYLEKVSLNGN